MGDGDAAPCPPLFFAGFRVLAAATVTALLSLALATTDTVRLSRVSLLASGRPHVAGDGVQPRLLTALLGEFAASGLDTSRTVFRAYVPHPRSTILARLQPYPSELPIVELRVGDDSLTYSGIWPIFSAYAPVADITAPVVYVNEGRPRDYGTLDSLRVSPAGTLVIARRGRCAPWAVAATAAAHGARGLLLYSDPMRDGYMQGEFYPDGRMRHPDAAERLLIRTSVGDPGVVPADSGFPVISIGFKQANQLMSMMQKPAVPNAWQGALPFRYRAGLGEVRARVVTDREKGDTGWKSLANGFAVLRGASRPDEVILVGVSYDAVGPGAVESGSGIAVAAEVAAGLASARRAGWRPARTIVFALWDGGAWGQLGAHAWLSAQPDSALDRVVAYLDLRSVAAGDSLVAEGSPLLGELLAGALRGVALPAGLRAAPAADVAAALRPAAGPTDPALMHEGYGIPSLRVAFEGLDGVRRTGYDTPTYVRRFGDPGWKAHAAVASIIERMIRRLEAEGGAALSPVGLAAAVRREMPARDARLSAALATIERLAPARRVGLERRMLSAGRSPFDWSRHLLWGTEASCGDRVLTLPRVREATDATGRSRALATAILALESAGRP